MDDELSALEAKLAALIEHCHKLRGANETLRAHLLATQEENRALANRITIASTRIDALIAQLPVTSE